MLKTLALTPMLLLAAIAATAQDISGPATFSPAAPTDHDQIIATYTGVGACTFNSSTVLSGNVVRTTVNVVGCIIGPPPVLTDQTAVFGPLPANTYTYELYVSYEGGTAQLRSQQQLVVTAAPPAAIPAMSATLLAVLLLSLGIVAVVALGRTG